MFGLMYRGKQIHVASASPNPLMRAHIYVYDDPASGIVEGERSSLADWDISSVPLGKDAVMYAIRSAFFGREPQQRYELVLYVRAGSPTEAEIRQQIAADEERYLASLDIPLPHERGTS